MTGETPQREPRIFETGDPALLPEPESKSPEADDIRDVEPPVAVPRSGIGWGAILVSALVGLGLLAASALMARFAARALERDDLIGWTAMALLAIACVAALAIVLREAFALMRLRRLGRLRRELDEALDARDTARERKLLASLISAFAGRGDVKWGLARYREHVGDVRDPGDLARLADREIFASLDRQAKKIVLTSAKRVSVVTAISPMPLIDVGYVLVENLRMLRALATLYGGRPGVMAGLKLGRMVLTHIVATGGVALTDDLLGQFLGQDLLRRLSRRLGEGAFNGAMTARVGTAAIHLIRPLAFLDAPPVRVRDFLAELFRSLPASFRGGGRAAST